MATFLELFVFLFVFQIALSSCNIHVCTKSLPPSRENISSNIMERLNIDLQFGLRWLFWILHFPPPFMIVLKSNCWVLPLTTAGFIAIFAKSELWMTEDMSWLCFLQNLSSKFRHPVVYLEIVFNGFWSTESQKQIFLEIVVYLWQDGPVSQHRKLVRFPYVTIKQNLPLPISYLYAFLEHVAWC